MSKISQSKLNSIFYKLSSIYPNPKTELIYANHYTFLIAVILSAQSTDISVNKVTKKLFNSIKSPKDMIRLGEKKLKKQIRTIGLYNSKAKNIISLIGGFLIVLLIRSVLATMDTIFIQEEFPAQRVVFILSTALFGSSKYSQGTASSAPRAVLFKSSRGGCAV